MTTAGAALETPPGLAGATCGYASSSSSLSLPRLPQPIMAAQLHTAQILPATRIRMRMPRGSATIPCGVWAAAPPTGALRVPSSQTGAISTLSLGRTGVREPAPRPRLHLRLITGVGGEEAEAAEEGPSRARRGANLYEGRALLPLRLA